MSKLSVHISANPEGLDPLLLKCAQANSPISVIYSVNQNIADSIARNSPGTKWIYRRQTEAFNRLPNAFYIEDPTQNARQWLSQTRDPADKRRTQVENWQLNPATWYDPLNEPVIEIADPDNPAQVADAVRKAQWLNTWMITALNIADGLGFKLALFSFPTGSPPLLKWNEVNTSQIQVPSNPECQAVVWHYLLPALRHGKQSGAVLSLHAYWEDRDPSVDRRDALRYRDLMRILPSDAQLPIVISEASSGNGYNTSLHGQRWIDNMGKWDTELMKDPIILAGCAFQLGVGAESNLAEIMPQYGDYIAAHPTPIGPPPNPPDASPDGTMAPPAVSITGSAPLSHQKDRKILNVPYLSQLAPSANFAPGDCGSSNVAMVLRFHGATLTVNDVSQATGQPEGFTSLGNIDLINVAAKFDLTLRRQPNFSIAELRRQIDTGKPCIVLVNYPLLPHRFDPNYTRAHYLVVVGHTSDGLIYHDPFFRDDDGEAIEIVDADFDRAWSTLPDNQDFTIPRQALLDVAFMPSDTELSANLDATVPHTASLTAAPDLSSAEPPQPSPAWRGLHMRADGNSTDADFQCIEIAKLNAAKIMTNTSFEEYTRLRSMVQPDRIVLRLFAAGDNPSLGNAKQFFDEQFQWLDEFSQRGSRFVEIHNEPNLPIEGFGKFWPTPDDFGVWYRDVARQIRTAFPMLLLGWPGLSPQDNVPEFMPVLDASLQAGLVDWIGAHAYWVNAAGLQSVKADGLPSIEEARYYRRFLNKGKPVLITEFANVGDTDSDAVKGQQYKQYYNTLESGVLAAFAFVSSASDPAFNQIHETWVRDGVVTAIPGVAGS